MNSQEFTVWLTNYAQVFNGPPALDQWEEIKSHLLTIKDDGFMFLPPVHTISFTYEGNGPVGGSQMLTC